MRTGGFYLNKLVAKIADAYVDVLIKELVDQTLPWIARKGKRYISRTIEKGRQVEMGGQTHPTALEQTPKTTKD